MARDLVLLHGFGATARAWDAVVAELAGRERYRPRAIDLPGHGSAAAMRPISFATCVRHVLAQSPQSFDLIGYSMGGRIALHVALAQGARVRRLVLVSTTAGIEQEPARAARRRSDRQLAEELQSLPYEQWIARWRAQPLFAGDPPEVSRAAARDQRRNSPADLAAALRGVGGGHMQPLWGRLRELAMPVAVVVGERDGDYRALGERLVRDLPRASLHVLPGGHVLPLENPAGVAAVIAHGDD